MAKTIEVIAELNHDSVSSQSTIDQIIAYCGKNQHDDLTESEFINW